MKAVFVHDIGEASIEDIPKPTPDRGEVLIKVSRVQLSITECDLYQGIAKSYFESFLERIEDGGAQAFGHEFCGVIEETGAGVDTFDVGDRVYAPGKIICGECAYCRSNYPQFCDNNQIIGRHRPGALAEYVTVPVGPLCTLPDEVSDAEGATLQPIASSLLAVHDARVTTGDVIVVIGTGVMGYMCGQFALWNGAGAVIGIDIDPKKLELARSRGLIPIDARESDAVTTVRDLTDGVGADIVFEAVGGEQRQMTTGPDPLGQAFEMVRPGGKIVQIGHIVGDLHVDAGKMRSKKVRWVNPLTNVISMGPNATTGELAADLIGSGRVSIEEYITHELDGLESFDEALDITVNKEKYGALSPAQIVL